MLTEKSKVCRTAYIIFCYLYKKGREKINSYAFACMCTEYLWEDTLEMELCLQGKELEEGRQTWEGDNTAISFVISS